MKQLMRYKITSGRVVEKRDVLMDCSRTRRPRGGRKGKSTIKQVERNERETVLELARFINCNHRGGDLFVTLKYSPPAGRRPAGLWGTISAGWHGPTGRPRGKN